MIVASSGQIAPVSGHDHEIRGSAARDTPFVCRFGCSDPRICRQRARSAAGREGRKPQQAHSFDRTRADNAFMSSRRCVVIGAGILGASVAARLAAAGLRVTLLDQDEPGRATSRWSFAWINSNDKVPRPYHDLNHAGMRAWAELAPDLDGDAWYRPVGHVELAASRAELEARVQRLTDWGYPARLIDVAEAAALEPALRVPPDATAAFFPDEGYLLTEPLIARLVAYAESRGAEVRTSEPGRVTGLDTSPDASP